MDSCSSSVAATASNWPMPLNMNATPTKVWRVRTPSPSTCKNRSNRSQPGWTALPPFMVSQLRLMQSLVDAGLLGGESNVSLIEWEYRNRACAFSSPFLQKFPASALFLHYWNANPYSKSVKLMPDTPAQTVGIQAQVVEIPPEQLNPQSADPTLQKPPRLTRRLPDPCLNNSKKFLNKRLATQSVANAAAHFSTDCSPWPCCSAAKCCCNGATGRKHRKNNGNSATQRTAHPAQPVT